MPYSKTASYSATRATLERFGLTAKYMLGQNFLVNDEVVGHICELAELTTDDVVLEVGPGIGTLTSALLPRVAAVVAVETDRDMCGPLSETTADYSERLALVVDDALRVTPERVAFALGELAAHGLALPEGRTMPNRWISNLPYAVAATLLLKYFSTWPSIDSAVTMVQSEVADRICAGPGSKVYGAYTVKLRLFADVTGRFQVPPTCFFPAPHIESAVVRVERKPAGENTDPAFAAHFANVVDAAFAQRRKTIRNSMSAVGGWTKDQLEGAYASCGIAPTCRAETLGLDEFVALARALPVTAPLKATGSLRMSSGAGIE